MVSFVSLLGIGLEEGEKGRYIRGQWWPECSLGDELCGRRF